MTPSTGAHAHASTAARWKSEWFGNVRADVLAGIVVALALIPEAIGFSIIAGVDPRVGLYASVAIAMVIAFTGGYPFASGSTVNMNISGNEFELFTEGEWAWPATTADDAKIIAAMKRGADATLTARSSRGTQTKDTFSLLGFTAAVEDAAKRCGG